MNFEDRALRWALRAVAICAAVVGALYLLIVFIIPAVLTVLLGAALLVALGFSLYNYSQAIYENMNLRDWDWDYGDPSTREPARRSYFFGPGYVQMGRTIREAFVRNYASGRQICLRVRDWGFGRRQNRILRGLAIIGSVIFIAFACVSFFVLSMVVTAVFSVVFGAVLLLVMLLTYLIFSITRFVDFLYLNKRKISCDCPICHERMLTPIFVCDQCGRRHRQLVPGVYGIWKHKCECGAKLPSTFLNGRSRLEALCRKCEAPLAASDARPLVFQLVGGTRAGKTVFLTSFYHQYRDRLSRAAHLNAYPPEAYRPYFDQMEIWYQGAEVPPTYERNSQMYPLMVDVPGDVRRMLTIYDIAGEMFDEVIAGQEIEQKHFTYCDGFLFLLDPFSFGRLRKNREAMNGDVADFSNVGSDKVADGFVSYCHKITNTDETSRIQKPLAVLIAKADAPEVEGAIGRQRIEDMLQKDPQYRGFYGSAEEKAALRQELIDRTCRSFLVGIGQQYVVNRLEASFAQGQVHYYPVSAIGHSPNHQPYDPWGTMEPLDDLISAADSEFARLVGAI